MEQWWMYLLTFVFGYVTCRTFYFVRAARVSLTLVRGAHIIYLSALMHVLEYLANAREIMLEHMLIAEKSATQISSFEFRFEQDTKLLKERSIDVLLYCHPSPFRQMLEFEDWEGAMRYLDENSESALKFWDKRP
tara:strand:- start:1206 stop:1610 length:405 start_codon:yes stop_codon:yes gene_type:complete